MSEKMPPGSSYFKILAILPVAKSFGFVECFCDECGGEGVLVDLPPYKWEPIPGSPF